MSTDLKTSTGIDLTQDTVIENKVTKGGDSDGVSLNIGTNDAQNVFIKRNGVDQIRINEFGTSVLENSLFVNDGNIELSSNTGVVKARGLVANDNITGLGFQPTESGGGPVVRINANGTLETTDPSYETNVTSDAIFPNRKYVTDAITAIPPPDLSTKVTKGGDADGAPLVIGTTDNQNVEIISNGTTAMSFTPANNTTALGNVQVNGAASTQRVTDAALHR